MRDGIITVNARPIRFAFLVDPMDVDSLQRVIEVNTFLWGGKFNAIIPTFQDVPKDWYCDQGMNTQDIVSGYLDNFDPDYVVPMGECSNYDLNYGDREVIDHYSIFFAGAAVDGKAGCGVGLLEILSDYTSNNEFELNISGRQICMPCFGNSPHPLLSSLFGTLPENITQILEEKFENYLKIERVDCSISNYTEFIKAQTYHMPEYLFEDKVPRRREYLMGINSRGLSRTSSGENIIFFFDADNPIDSIDYWNLRAIGKSVYPIPKQFSQDENLKDFARSNLVQPTHSIISSIKSNPVSEEEYLEFFNSIKCKPFQIPYPQMWGKLPYRDKHAMRSFSSETRYHDIHDLPSGQSEILNTLSPNITPGASISYMPRFANEIWFRVHNDKLISTSVLPEGFKDLSVVCHPNNFVRAAKNNLVYLVHEPESYFEIRLPESTVIFEKWMNSQGWDFEISNAGHVVTQIIKRLGTQFFGVFAIKGIIELLDEMKDEKSLLQQDLWNKIREIVKQRLNSDGTVKNNSSEIVNPQVREILKNLVDAKVLQPGMKMSCPNCKQSSWHSMEDAGYILRCPRCLDSFNFPYKPGDEIKWAYRRLGPFDSPSKAEGAYTTLLLLRFFADLQMLGGAVTSLMSFNLKKENIIDEEEGKIVGQEVGKEVDLGLFFQLTERDDIATIFAECKTGGSFKEKDIEKMEILGKKFPEAVLAFAKLGDLTDSDKKSLSELSLRSLNTLLILTGEDLLCQSLRDDYKNGIMSFDRLCRITHDLYLENYEHGNCVLNGPIIRDILNKAILYGLYEQQEWLSVREFKDRIEQFHSRNGGKPSELKDFPTNLRDILTAMEVEGKAEACREGRTHHWRLV